MSIPKRILITAGPTHESIDAVRYVANRSSGRMGVALAEAACEAGCDVTLLLGPTAGDGSQGVTTLRFTSADDLKGLLDDEFDECDVLVMAAAVADYRPVRKVEGKLKRRDEGLVIEFERTEDIVARLAGRKRGNQKVIGFALEEEGKVDEGAKQKLIGKGLDAIVGNSVKTMNAIDIDASVFLANGKVMRPGEMSKADFAAWLIGQIIDDVI